MEVTCPRCPGSRGSARRSGPAAQRSANWSRHRDERSTIGTGRRRRARDAGDAGLAPRGGGHRRARRGPARTRRSRPRASATSTRSSPTSACPDKDGVALLGELRQARPETPVILMTAFGSIDSAVEAMRGGAFDYITKPFKRGAVLAVARARLRAARARAGEPPAAPRARPHHRVRRPDRREPGDARDLRADPQDLEQPLERADHRRERHRQGSGRAHDPLHGRARATRRSCRSTAPPCPRACSRASSSATCAAPSPARTRPSADCSRRRTAARSSSTRSAT